MTKNLFDDQDEPLTPIAAPSLSMDVGKSKLNPKILKKVAIILIPLLLCSIGGIYFFFKVIRAPKSYDASGFSPSKIEEIVQNTYIDFDQMIVNLASPGSKPNYLKITITIQLGSENETKFVQAKIPIIVDAFQTFLRELRATDFSSSGGTMYVKEELIKRINKITYPVVIKDVLFKELIVN